MTEQKFREAIRQQGYEEPVMRTRGDGQVNTEHTHVFSVRVFVLEGELQITMPDSTFTCHKGDSDGVAANTPHTETTGPDGVTFQAAQKPG